MADSNQSLNGAQKAAIVLITMGPVDGAKILAHISEEETSQLTKAIVTLDNVPHEQVQSTLHEFDRLISSQQLFLKGGMEYAEKMLTEAYGPSVTQDLVHKLQKSSGTRPNFDKVLKAEPQQLAKLIEDEHPQTIALVLSHLDASKAATLLRCLPGEIRMDVAARIAGLDQISPEIVHHIATTIEQKLLSLGEMSRESCGGVRAVANIFNRLDPTTCTELMEAFKAEKPPLFEDIRQLMFIFRDLENLNATALTLLVSKTPRTTLVTALKGANESLRQKFLSTQSQRGAGMLAEEIASLGPVKLRTVDAAQQEIIAIARELEKEGEITLSTTEDEEQYVV